MSVLYVLAAVLGVAWIVTLLRIATDRRNVSYRPHLKWSDFKGLTVAQWCLLPLQLLALLFVLPAVVITEWICPSAMEK